ncbi:CSPP1 protein, partial [Brachypteracias leptosomus]|nr:CSPP1 protein [Brachypteracias leptosomus]
MADDLDKFIEDQKARLAQDKADLENDPPYMEMRDKEPEQLSETSKMLLAMAKENIPPNSQQNSPLGDYGLSLPLGEEYERKKHKLKEELRQDYRRYLSQEKLRLERNKEYNQYLREKEEWNERLRRWGRRTTFCQNEMDRNKNPIAVTRLQAELLPPNTDAEPPKKDAFTSTEGYEELLNKRWLEEDKRHRLDDEAEVRSGALNRRLAENGDAPSGRHCGFASQPVVPVRKHPRPYGHQDFGRRYYRMDYEPEMSEETDPGLRCESAYDRRSPRGLYAERYPSSLPSFLSGDQALLQRRKEKYRQELMEQMAEQQRNRRREKELQLSVAASGAQDPEKQPNRLKQFGLSARAPEERVPPERPWVAFQTPVPLPSASPVNEDFQRGLTSALPEIAAPRLAPRAAAAPAVLADSYRTPYDEAYYFYGARNPLDPSLAYYGTGLLGMQPTPALDPPASQAQAEQSLNTGQRNSGDRQRSAGAASEANPKPSQKATLSYQQELQQQIREREERRRQEREEKRRYEAKLEAEMRSYNPWGKGGGGAPLRDAEGNLITDLNKMHKQNEDAYHNPGARLHEDKRALVTVDLSLASPGPENAEASTNKRAGLTSAQPSPFARGNVFGEPPSPQQLKRQESYKNFLRLQIEEKRRREEAEREKLRLEEEKAEKRLAAQKLRIQKAFEDEEQKRRRKEEEGHLKNKELIRLDEERRKEAEKRRREEEEKQDEQQTQQAEKEKEEEEKMLPRQPPPVTPALQSREVRGEERIPSAGSPVSNYAQGPPPPRVPSPPVPARRNQLRALEERSSVINELSEMRKQLRSEERRLQEQLLSVASDEEVPITRRERNPKEIFELARLRLQAPVWRPPSKEAQEPLNPQNIWEFNQLRYKGRKEFTFPASALDSETRMGLRHMYPDPPKDARTLEIQQQALLREQQKRLDRMRMRRGTQGKECVVRGQLRGVCSVKASDEFPSNSLLESDSAFLGANGETFPALEEESSPPQLPLSARERRRLKQKALESAVRSPSLPPDGFSLRSSCSLDVEELRGRNEDRLQGLAQLQQKAACPGDDLSFGDPDDLHWKQVPPSSARRPSSVDTVATEAWLRPGTSETLQRFLAEERSPAKLAAELPRGWQGLSTAHG